MGNEKKVKNDHPFLSHFECPICLDYAFPPIPQCPNGHIVCSTCKVKITSCPTCRATMGDIRNLTLEKLVGEVMFPCKFTVNGCNERIHYKEKANHEKTCDFKLFHCPGPDTSCKWFGCVTTVHEHLATHEPVVTAEGKRVKLIAVDVNRQGSVFWVLLQSCFEHHFMTFIEKQSINGNDKFFAFTKLLGTRAQADKFGVKVELKNKTGKLMWSGTPHSMNDDLNEMRNACLSFDSAVAKQCIKEEKLSIIISVMQNKI